MRVKEILMSAAMLVAVSANAQEKYEIGNPGDPLNYGYLADYAALKDYIDYEKYPNFKLGIGTTVNEYLQKGIVYKLTNANFTETVAGNAMKYASCVNGNGDMNFTTVKNYVNAATAAGLNIYGHTLAWHSQQQPAYLNGLIKDKPAPAIDGDVDIPVEIATKDFTTQQSIGWHSDYSQYNYSVSFNKTDGLIVHNTKKAANFWDVQYIVMDNILTDKGETYQMTMTIKGSDKGSLHTKLGDWNGGPTATVPFTTEWQDVTVKYKSTVAGCFFLLQSGDFVGDIYIKKITFSKVTKGQTTTEDRRCIVVDADAKQSDAWDNQFWILTESFAANSTYEFSAEVRADKPAKASTQVHSAPGTYVDAQALGDVEFTTDWKTVKASGKLNKAGSSIAFNLNELADANNYYFDNVSLKINGVERVKNGDLEGEDVSSFKQKTARGSVVPCTIAPQITYVYVPSTTPLTKEEKLEILTGAMEKWIKGMMEACNGKVKAWDVVNEAISGGGADSEGVYALQHENGSGDFFWQDHMGDLDYVRTAVRLARKYGPEDVKLFINDYNLESDWDSNGKLKSLIKWIKRWEADGVTYIDGIGSQMHISCYMNDNTQASKKRAIENMLKLMAQTGKLVRISELDMGMVDKNGKDVTTANMTEDMHHHMAELYKWIVQKYLEIVPVDQQWGICQWCPTDSPANSGWRANTPVGLWTLNYYRKHAYAGVAEGLGGVVMAIEDVTADRTPSSNAIYDLNGIRQSATSLDELPRGIYIVGGKKVVK